VISRLDTAGSKACRDADSNNLAGRDNLALAAQQLTNKYVVEA
jgi:hypothetical protein